MYLGHFGLTELPFSITPDTQFVYSAASHQEALNTLLLAVRGGEGFVKITGEVGTGKTLLCRRFLATLGEECVAAYVPNPQIDAASLLQEVADELRVTEATNSTSGWRNPRSGSCASASSSTTACPASSAASSAPTSTIACASPAITAAGCSRRLRAARSTAIPAACRGW